VIRGVVLANAVIGFLQESKAEKAIEALAQMAAAETTVRRDGKKQRVPSTELISSWSIDRGDGTKAAREWVRESGLRNGPTAA
jgi:hypothetical protein